MTALLDVNNLSTGYGKAEVIPGLSLHVKAGSIVTVIGPNGAGKTTLLNAIMGLQPSRGAVSLDGRDISATPVEDRLAAGLCLVAEKRELFGQMSVEDNLVLGGYSRRKVRDGSRERDLEEAYKQFPRLLERKSQVANTLSGGERQMLAIARALMSRPRLLMLDEPSLGLAPLIVKEVLEKVSELRETGVSILIVEQNARAALQIADYGYVLESGSAALEGPASELAGNRHIVETYLGVRKY
ncbi:ABC transporter ATP-binding protein (plasmid) [Agrobacterium leguminum]|uniref:ABC transporter ATP-binding protein n=1 Tax=Agrobacterium leguminum TaxID=2792015 RepID=UPI00272CD6B7|nr:ABC transporter ATP-binding protein [Agrobacterium leguminum]WLE00710.1 ABC transporter ATP-binding protein [Agrobacterium leguminum]